jgi:cytochrome c
MVLLPAMTVFAPRGAPAADAQHGSVIFQICAACHNERPDALGPRLGGVVGRAAGTLEGFRYSNAMKRASFTWNIERLRTFVRDPQSVVAGNRMPFSGLTDPRDVEDVVSFLENFK